MEELQEGLWTRPAQHVTNLTIAGDESVDLHWAPELTHVLRMLPNLCGGCLLATSVSDAYLRSMAIAIINDLFQRSMYSAEVGIAERQCMQPSLKTIHLV